MCEKSITFLTFKQQVELFKKRGMIIENEEEFKEFC
jgi:hypothetical protein